MAGKLELAEYYRQKFLAMANEAKEKTEQLYMNVIRAYPDLGDTDEFDSDTIGRHHCND